MGNYFSTKPTSPKLKCTVCGSETGWVAVKAEHVDIPKERFLVGLLLLEPFGASGHPAVVISFGCEHCDHGKPVYVTYEYGPKGVHVKEGYPFVNNDPPTISGKPIWRHHHHSAQYQLLLYSQVKEIVETVMNWPASDYNAMTRNCQHWADEFMLYFWNITPHGVPWPPFKFVKADIVEQETGEVLQRNVGLQFWNKNHYSGSGVTVSQMAVKALEQSGLNADYIWRSVEHYKEFVTSDDDYPTEYEYKYVKLAASRTPIPIIYHGASYKVVVVRKSAEKLIVNVELVGIFDSPLLAKMKMLFFGEAGVDQMADEALEQSGLKAEGYQWVEVKQRKGLSHGYECIWDDRPIEHGAFYRVVVQNPAPFIARLTSEADKKYFRAIFGLPN